MSAATKRTPAAKRTAASDRAPATKRAPAAPPESTGGARQAAAPRTGTADQGDQTEAGGLELSFLRHADAGDPAEWVGEDADRPLSKKGRRQAKRLGRLLAELRFRPDVLLTSPKLRAADTARSIGRAIKATVETDPRLASALGPAELGEIIDGLDATARRVMLVGHDPEFSTLLSWIVGAPLSLRKGALATIDLPSRTVGADGGSLRWLLPPDAVPD